MCTGRAILWFYSPELSEFRPGLLLLFYCCEKNAHCYVYNDCGLTGWLLKKTTRYGLAQPWTSWSDGKRKIWVVLCFRSQIRQIRIGQNMCHYHCTFSKTLLYNLWKALLFAWKYSPDKLIMLESRSSLLDGGVQAGVFPSIITTSNSLRRKLMFWSLQDANLLQHHKFSDVLTAAAPTQQKSRLEYFSTMSLLFQVFRPPILHPTTGTSSVVSSWFCSRCTWCLCRK